MRRRGLKEASRAEATVVETEFVPRVESVASVRDEPTCVKMYLRLLYMQFGLIRDR